MNLQQAKSTEKKERIKRAGIIPFFIKEGKIQMLFMKPSDPEYGGSHWQIGKGGIDEGETPVKAAVREGKEELGLLRNNIDQLFSLGSFWSGYFDLFAAVVKSKKKFVKPHFETKATRWMTWGDWFVEGRREQTKLVAAAYKIIKSGLQ